MEIAQTTQTNLQQGEERQTIVDSRGKQISEAKSEVLSELVWGTVSDAYKFSNERGSSIPACRSLMDFFEEKVKEKDLDPTTEQNVLKAAKMWGAFVGDPVERQSLRFFWLEETIDGGMCEFPRSMYSQLILDRRKPLRRKYIQ